MSLSAIEEQYQAAARQKRTLDAPAFPAEYIRTQPTWECRCGNTPEAQGFHLWNRASWRYAETEAEALASTPGYGPTYYYRCDRCFRTIVGPQGYVTDPPVQMRDVYGATFTQPERLCATIGCDNDATRGAYCDTCCEHDADGDPIDPPTQPCREINEAERAAIDVDSATQSFKAGAYAARSCAALFGLPHAESRSAAVATYASDHYAKGWASEVEQIRRETLEAVYGVCADCETPLENGVCLRCLEG